MKKLVPLFLFLVNPAFPQIQPVVSDFQISGLDNSPSTFTQHFPNLSFTNSDNFVVSWSDYRNGQPVKYSQKFDSEGNKIGNNFKPEGSYVFINKTGYLLTLNYETESFFDNSYIHIIAGLYNNSNQEILKKQIFSGFVPWCGTGFISGRELVTTSNGFFYFLSNFSGQLTLVKIDKAGTIKSFNLPFDDLNSIVQITHSATSDGNYCFSWLKGGTEDSLETGIYSTFINKDDSIIVEHLPLKLIHKNPDYWDYIGNFNLRSVALNNTTYKIFWLDNETLFLYSVKANTNGEIISDVDSLRIDGTTGEFSSPPELLLSNIMPDGFYIALSQQTNPQDYNVPAVYLNTLIKYDISGDKMYDILT